VRIFQYSCVYHTPAALIHTHALLLLVVLLLDSGGRTPAAEGGGVPGPCLAGAPAGVDKLLTLYDGISPSEPPEPYESNLESQMES